MPGQSKVNARATPEACVTEIRQWMADNWLLFNDGKTKFMILSSRFADPATIHVVHIGDAFVPVISTAHNLDFIFDPGMSFVQQVNSSVKSSFGEVRKFSMMRNSLTLEA